MDDLELAPRNVLGGELESCSLEPLAGFYRTGCCETGPEDLGVHSVCTQVTEEFLEFSRHAGQRPVDPRAGLRLPWSRPGRPLVRVRDTVARGLGSGRRATRLPRRDARGDAGRHARGAPAGPRSRRARALRTVLPAPVWITMPDGIRLGRRPLPPRGCRAVRRAARSAPVPQGRPDGLLRRRVPPARRRGALRGVPARPAGHRLVGGPRRGRVPRGRAARPGRGHRVAGRPAVVERARGHVRHELLGLQLDPDGLRAAAGAARHLRDLRHRRPLHRRCPLHGRRAAGDRSRRLLPLHDADERPSTSAGDLRARMAGRVAAPGRAGDAVDAAMVAGATRRPVLAPWIAAT